MSGIIGGERTILGVNQYQSQSTFLSTFFKIGVKVFIWMLVIMQYFVFWDPIIEKNSEANHMYNSLREKGNEHMRKVSVKVDFVVVFTL